AVQLERDCLSEFAALETADDDSRSDGNNSRNPDKHESQEGGDLLDQGIHNSGSAASIRPIPRFRKSLIWRWNCGFAAGANSIVTATPAIGHTRQQAFILERPCACHRISKPSIALT